MCRENNFLYFCGLIRKGLRGRLPQPGMVAESPVNEKEIQTKK